MPYNKTNQYDEFYHCTLDLADYARGRIGVTIETNLDVFHFYLPKIGNGLWIEDLVAVDAKGNTAITGYESKDVWVVRAYPRGTIRYTLCTDYRDCVGAERERYVVYPFANEDEIFLSVGALPIPFVPNASYTLTIANLPPDFDVFTNLYPMQPEKLGSFFWYASRHQHQTDLLLGEAYHLTMVVQHGKSIAPTPAGLSSFLADWVGTLRDVTGVGLRHTGETKLLILQAPDDFEALANGRTFATGENMQGGIACYAPRSPDYLQKVFGYSDYGYFLLYGLVHELGHYYVSGSDQTGKSWVYAAKEAPREVRQLIGEALIGYLHRWYLHRYHLADMAAFVAHLRGRWEKHPQRAEALIRWLLADVALRRDENRSVWAVLRHLVTEHAGPYYDFSPLAAFPTIYPLLTEPLDPDAIRAQLDALDLTLLA